MFGRKKEIASLKQALDEARARISKLEGEQASVGSVLESMVEGVLVVDKDTRIISLNSSADKIFGISKKEYQGRFFLEALRNNDIAEVINRVLKEGAFVSQELKLVWPIQRTFQINASAVFEGSTVNGCLVVIHDITEMRRLEAVRSDFVANVSHEIKTPLTSIKGFVETLLEGALEDKENSRDFLKVINEQVERLDALVNDLLELSSLEAKEAALNKERFDLAKLAENMLIGFRSQIAKKSIKVKNELSPGLFIQAEKKKIGQVFANLIDNAIKFNREGGLLRIYCEELPDSAKVWIEDSGIGIPEKDLPRIFERFYRVDKARSRELGGTGLGLSIVKHIVQLHDGKAGVESIEGLGSKFWFSLPK